MTGEFEPARSLLLELHGVPDTDDAAAVEMQMFVRAELARIAIFLDGDLAQARELLHEGLAMASGEETMKAELMLRHQLGNLTLWQGDFAEAIRIHEENVERAGEGAQFYRRGWGLNSLSYALAQSGELDRAMSVADRVIRAADELGDPRLRMGGIAQKGLIALKREQWTEALAWFGEAQDLNRRNGDPEKVSTVANYLGEAALGAGQPERATAEFDRGARDRPTCRSRPGAAARARRASRGRRCDRRPGAGGRRPCDGRRRPCRAQRGTAARRRRERALWAHDRRAHTGSGRSDCRAGSGEPREEEETR